VVSFCSFVVMLLYAVPEPWSSLIYPIEVPIRPWTAYLPIVANLTGQ
jgi:hypothetical protein